MAIVDSGLSEQIIDRAEALPSRYQALHPVQRLVRASLRLLHYIEYSRTTSALDRLTDSQLAHIGVRRSEIPDYARKLVFEVSEGSLQR